MRCLALLRSWPGADAVCRSSLCGTRGSARRCLRLVARRTNPSLDLWYRGYREPKQKQRFLTPTQKHQLVDAIHSQNDWVGHLAGLLAETRLRLDDGLHLQWGEHRSQAAPADSADVEVAKPTFGFRCRRRRSRSSSSCQGSWALPGCSRSRVRGSRGKKAGRGAR